VPMTTARPSSSAPIHRFPTNFVAKAARNRLHTPYRHHISDRAPVDTHGPSSTETVSPAPPHCDGEGPGGQSRASRKPLGPFHNTLQMGRPNDAHTSGLTGPTVDARQARAPDAGRADRSAPTSRDRVRARQPAGQYGLRGGQKRLDERREE